MATLLTRFYTVALAGHCLLVVAGLCESAKMSSWRGGLMMEAFNRKHRTQQQHSKAHSSPHAPPSLT